MSPVGDPLFKFAVDTQGCWQNGNVVDLRRFYGECLFGTEKYLKNKRHHGRNEKSIRDYFWSGERSFSGLERHVSKMLSENGPVGIKNFFTKLHVSYKRACIALHANSMGNSIRLGDNSDFSGIDTAPRTKGHSTPLWFSAVSLEFVIMNVSELVGIDYSKYQDRLDRLADFYNTKELEEMRRNNG